MSRVGKSPVPVPSGVSVKLDGQSFMVKGPKGELALDVHPAITVSQDSDDLVVTRSSDAPTHRALHGLTRALIANMVMGVTDGFKKSLELRGTGYRAQLQGQKLVLSVGYSHPVEIDPLDGAAFEVETPTLVHVNGIDKQIVGQQAALVRRVRPPEPYHGKGVRYVGEYVRQKAGKARV
jgi:large subunit ribosomal protein L6